MPFCVYSLNIMSLLFTVLGLVDSGTIIMPENEDKTGCLHTGNKLLRDTSNCVVCALSDWIFWTQNYLFASDNERIYTFNLLEGYPPLVKMNWRVLLLLKSGNEVVDRFNLSMWQFLSSDKICRFGDMTIVKSLLMRSVYRDKIDFGYYWVYDNNFPLTLMSVLLNARERDEYGYAKYIHKINVEKMSMMLIFCYCKIKQDRMSEASKDWNNIFGNVSD